MINLKKMTQKTALLLMGFMLSGLAAAAENNGDGGLPGAFLRFGAGARAFSMGRAFTAVANDASAAYWNPAGLGDLHYREFMGTYGMLSLERKHNFMAFALPVEEMGTFSLSWVNLGVNGIQGYNTEGNKTHIFSNSENAFYMSYGRKLNDYLLLGFSGKFLLHSLDTHRATGLGFDAGLLYKLTPQIRLGASLQNLGAKLKWDTDYEDEIPASTRVGLSYTLNSFPALLACDYEMVSDQDARIHIGVESQLFSSGGVRLGLDHGHFAAGGFLSIPVGDKVMQADYSVSEDPIDKSFVHRLSLAFRFSSPIEYIQARDKAAEYDELNALFNSGQPIPDARIIKLTPQFPNYALINSGSMDGLSVGLIYNVYRDMQPIPGDPVQNVMIGTAKVVKVEDDMAAIRVRWMKEGYYLQEGDVLIHPEMQEDDVDVKSDMLTTYPYP